MAASPFSVFRKNQRQMMVVVTGLAMFAFIFVSDMGLQSGQLPKSLSVLLIAALCAGGMWVVGNPRGKGNELALYGALIGGVIAFFGLRANGPQVLAVTSVGTYTRDDLMLMAQRRGTANRFVAMATQSGRASFGGTDDESLIQRALLIHEARKRGIALSNEAVGSYISEVTQNKLALPDYKQLLRDIGVAESDLYSCLKEELQAQVALAMDLPPAAKSQMGPIQSPLTFWKQFQMLNVRQSVDVAAVPVEAFMDKVPEANDKELQAFFERYKNQLPNSLTGEPGFLMDRQVNLAYVAADFEVFEKAVKEPSDQEVEEFYAANKQRYPVLDLPDTMLPTDTPEGGNAPASASEPANLTPPSGTPAAPAEPPAAAEPAAPATPEPATPDKETPAPALPEGGQAARRQSAVPVRLVSFQEPTAEPAAPATAPEAPATSAAEPAAPVEPVVPVTPAEPTLELPPGPANAPAVPEQKYRDLDEGLKLEIRETILRERAFEAMGKAVDAAFNEMTKYTDEYLAVEDVEKLPAKAEELTNRLKAYAPTHNLLYVETGLVTRDQLLDSVSEPIGSAVEPTANPFQRGASVTQLAFGNDSLYQPARADSLLRDKRYAYWKLADVAPNVPTLVEAKEQVLTEWKRVQARPLAEKRAQELAAELTKAGKPMVDAFSGQSVQGKDGATPLSVRETPRFSWLSMPSNLPFQFNPMFMPPPQLSMVDGVQGAGPTFMKTVFEDIAPGGVGVAPNESKSIYYVVQVKQRDATPAEAGDNLGLKSLQQQFLNEGRGGFEQGPYMYLGRDEIMQLLDGWRKSFTDEYAITMESEVIPQEEP